MVVPAEQRTRAEIFRLILSAQFDRIKHRLQQTWNKGRRLFYAIVRHEAARAWVSNILVVAILLFSVIAAAHQFDRKKAGTLLAAAVIGGFLAFVIEQCIAVFRNRRFSLVCDLLFLVFGCILLSIPGILLVSVPTDSQNREFIESVFPFTITTSAAILLVRIAAYGGL